MKGNIFILSALHEKSKDLYLSQDTDAQTVAFPSINLEKFQNVSDAEEKEQIIKKFIQDFNKGTENDSYLTIMTKLTHELNQRESIKEKINTFKEIFDSELRMDEKHERLVDNDFSEFIEESIASMLSSTKNEAIIKVYKEYSESITPYLEFFGSEDILKEWHKVTTKIDRLAETVKLLKTSESTIKNKVDLFKQKYKEFKKSYNTWSEGEGLTIKLSSLTPEECLTRLQTIKYIGKKKAEKIMNEYTTVNAVRMINEEDFNELNLGRASYTEFREKFPAHESEIIVVKKRTQRKQKKSKTKKSGSSVINIGIDSKEDLLEYKNPRYNLLNLKILGFNLKGMEKAVFCGMLHLMLSEPSYLIPEYNEFVVDKKGFNEPTAWDTDMGIAIGYFNLKIYNRPSGNQRYNYSFYEKYQKHAMLTHLLFMKFPIFRSLANKRAKKFLTLLKNEGDNIKFGEEIGKVYGTLYHAIRDAIISLNQKGIVFMFDQPYYNQKKRQNTKHTLYFTPKAVEFILDDMDSLNKYLKKPLKHIYVGANKKKLRKLHRYAEEHTEYAIND